MPFAMKFMAMMELPLAGETLGGLLVESITVGHEGRADGLYAYPLRMVLSGPGGVKAAVRAAKALCKKRCTTFSGFGTPYHMWFNKPQIEDLGGGRCLVTAEGSGTRVHLGADLERFCARLAEQGLLPGSAEEHAALIERYLEAYRSEVEKQVGRYRRRAEKAGRLAG